MRDLATSARKSAFDFEVLSLSISNSSAAPGSSPSSTRRSFQTCWSSSGSKRSSSRRVPEEAMSIAG